MTVQSVLLLASRCDGHRDECRSTPAGRRFNQLSEFPDSPNCNRGDSDGRLQAAAVPCRRPAGGAGRRTSAHTNSNAISMAWIPWKLSLADARNLSRFRDLEQVLEIYPVVLLPRRAGGRGRGSDDVAAYGCDPRSPAFRPAQPLRRRPPPPPPPLPPP